jgi:predicted hydrocarbon binding protein
MTDHQMVALPRASLLALNAALLRDAGTESARYLQESGYAASEALFAAFGAWSAERGERAPHESAVDDFQRQATQFFEECGWGRLAFGRAGEDLVTLDAPEWAEADAAVGADHPSCHLSTGLFAGLFEQVAGEPLAVLEVECRSAGSAGCRWLVGSQAVLGEVYERLARGESYPGIDDADAPTG